MTADVQAQARALAKRVESSAPALGSTRLLLIDGPAGAGKTTLAQHLSRVLSADAPIQTLHGDDMYEGWAGLPRLADVLIDQVIAPLAVGMPGVFRKWDWHAGKRGDQVIVSPRSVLIIEGVGVAMEAARIHASLVVWVEAPADVCLERGIVRDGEALRDEWVQWQQVEQREFDREGTRAAADVVITTS